MRIRAVFTHPADLCEPTRRMQIGGQEEVRPAEAEVQQPENSPAPTGDDLETPASSVAVILDRWENEETRAGCQSTLHWMRFDKQPRIACHSRGSTPGQQAQDCWMLAEVFDDSCTQTALLSVWRCCRQVAPAVQWLRSLFGGHMGR